MRIGALLAVVVCAAACGGTGGVSGPDERVAVEVGSAPTAGTADAAVTFVEFGDFECPYCGLEAPVVKQLVTNYGGQVLFAFKQFPLSFHPHAHLAAEASLAAHAQGRFWAYHDALYANQSALARADLDGYAQSLGLDTAAFAAALDGHTFAGAVDADKDQGIALGVPGTPTFFINGRMGSGALDYQILADAIEEELAR